MKQIINYVALLALGAIFGVVCTGSYFSHDYSMPTEPPEKQIEYVYIETEPETVVEYVYVPYVEEIQRNLTSEEAWYYMDLAMREAEGEGVEGMLWVMYTGECRCEAFGQTVKEMWKSPAFQTSMHRTGITPNEDCLKALELFREGWIPKPLWFQRGYYHGFGTPLCQVGNHCFSSK